MKNALQAVVLLVLCSSVLADSKPLELPLNADPGQVKWKLQKGKDHDAQIKVIDAGKQKAVVLHKMTPSVNNYITTPTYDVSEFAGQKLLLTFSYKLADYTHVATKPWHGANSQVMIYNKQDKRTITGGLTFAKPVDDWQTCEAMVEVPADAAIMQIKFSMLSSTGVFTIKAIELKKKFSAPN